MASPSVYFETSSLGDQFKAILEEGDNGVHTSFMERHAYPKDLHNAGSDIVFSGEHPMASKTRDILGSFSDPLGNIKKLYPFQIDAVANMAYRPPTIEVTKEIKKTRLNRNNSEFSSRTYTDSGVVDLKSDDDDIGMAVINDLFTGSGKTLTSVLGALLFAKDRRDAVIRRFPLLAREQLSASWNTRMARSSIVHDKGVTKNAMMCVDPAYSDTVVIMCSKHLVSQWVKACRQAMTILGIEVTVLVNPKKDPENQWWSMGKIGPRGSEVYRRVGPGLKIVVYDNTALLNQSGLKFVPAIIVDE